MLAVIRKCKNKDCGEEVTVIILDKTVRDGIYTWECPCCLQANTLPLAIGKK